MTMRELTMDEIVVVSGGTGDQNPNISPGQMMTVTASRISGNFFLSTGPSFGGVPSLALGNFSIASLAPDFQAAAGSDKDGDGVEDYYDEDPDDPRNNTIVTKPSPEAVAVQNFVTEYWGSLLAAMAGKHGGKHPIVAAVGADILGNITAEQAGRAALFVTESYVRGFEQQMRNAENGRFAESWANIP